MTELERVRDVEARLELAEEFHEAAERHIPALLQGLEERGVAFDENGSIGFISHAIALVKRLAINERLDLDTAKLLISAYKKQQKG